MRVLRVFVCAGIAFLTACSSSGGDNSAGQPEAGNAGSAGSDSGAAGGDSSVADAEVEAEGGQDASVDQAADACTQPTEPEPSECDLEKQDCACGKCVLYRKETDGNPIRVGCAPIRGDAGPGETCARYDMTLGDDTCASGYFCTVTSIPAGAPSDHICVKYCNTNDDCGTNEFCARGLGSLGWCEFRCDPFSDGCYEGLGCLPYTATDGIKDLVCRRSAGSQQVDQPCIATSDCEKNLICGDFAGTMKCAMFCDAEHPCPGADAGADGGSPCQAVPDTHHMLCTP